LHNQNTLRKTYPDVLQVDDTGSTAIFSGMQNPETWHSADSLAAEMDGRNTELVNRRAVGLSEAAQALEALNQVLHDIPEPLTESWVPLWKQHDMMDTVHCLNVVYTAAYPNYPRTPERMREALKNYLKFHTAIRLEWRKHTEAFAANITRSVSLAWVLQGAALTAPGAWANKLMSSVSREAPTELTALVADPSSASKLLNLLVAEMRAYGKVRSATVAKSSKACGSRDIMTFSDEEQEQAVIDAATKAAPHDKEMLFSRRTTPSLRRRHPGRGPRRRPTRRSTTRRTTGRPRRRRRRRRRRIRRTERSERTPNFKATPSPRPSIRQ
jgi:hypothetical protein